jgi:tRNA(Ile)-lysidine synthase
VRPLLEVSRESLRAYLASLDQPFCEDATNADVAIPRNRVRHELLPLLEARFSPAIKEILAREASIARDDEDRLEREAIDLADSIVLRVRGSVEVDRSALVTLHPALAVRVARLALQQMAPDRFVGYDHIERFLELARRQDQHGALSLPGQHAVRRGDTLLLSQTPFQPFSNSFQVSLSIPGEVVFDDWAISATGDTQSGQSIGTVKVECPRFSAVVDAGRVTLPLTVRSRKPGDRFRPLGMGGRERKLQDVLVDRKIPRERRDSLPLVVDGSDRILWIVGEAVAEDFRVTEPSQAVIFLKARRLGGQG